MLRSAPASRFAWPILIAVSLLIAAPPVWGQQSYISRFDLFTGYTFLDSPHVGLFENGFHAQSGVRLRTWVSLGVDYSITAGNLTLTPNLLLPALQQQLGAELAGLAAAGLLSPSYQLVVPAHSKTQTFAAGPQLASHHWTHFTLFVRPSVGAIHEVATPHPGDPIATLVANQLAPTGYKTDWTAFYGAGGGVDFLVSKHIAIRTQADLVYDHLFNDLLKDGRLTVRFSAGPCFNFGQNMAK
jgi:hypothetical protein